MKTKSILIILSLIPILFSCKKEDTGGDNLTKTAPKYPVAFAMSGITISTGSFSSKQQTTGLTTQSTAPLLSTNMNKLILVVFDSVGNQVSRLEQSRTYSTPVTTSTYRIANNKRVSISNSSFGSLSDSLAAGNYKVLVIGTDDWGTINAAKATPATPDTYVTNPLSTTKFYPNSTPVSDNNYYYRGTLTVTPTTAAQSITLGRIYGQVLLNIEDAIPANAGQVYLQSAKDCTYFDFNTNLPGGVIAYGTGYMLNPSDKGVPNKTFAINVLNTNTTVDIQIRINDENGVAQVTKYIYNVPVKMNQQTILSGRLFSNATGFNVSLNPDWGASTGTIHF